MAMVCVFVEMDMEEEKKRKRKGMFLSLLEEGKLGHEKGVGAVFWRLLLGVRDEH